MFLAAFGVATFLFWFITWVTVPERGRVWKWWTKPPS